MNTATRGDLGYLLSAKAVRERAEQLFALAERGELEHFALALERLPALSGSAWRQSPLPRIHGLATYPCMAATVISKWAASIDWLSWTGCCRSMSRLGSSQRARIS